ncbi:MAG TPA: FtsQ-type POTRA domain-containing protein [Oculatellaceae cyanobacterium]
MDSPGSDNSKQAQSVFSARSGIQDLLVKPAPPEEDASAKPETPDTSEQPPARRVKKSKRQIERVKRRHMSYLQERRAQKRRQVLFQRVRKLFKLCFAVLLAILLWEAIQSPVWRYAKPEFNLKDNHLLQKEQLAPLIKPWVGKPLYAVDTGKLAEQIKQKFRIVDKVFVRRQAFPNRLDIILSEKQPWAEVYLSEKHPRPYALLVPGGVIDLRGYAYRANTYQPALEKILLPPKTKLTPELMRALREITWQARHVKGLHFMYLDARNQRQLVLRFQEIPVILGKLNNRANTRLERLFPLAPKILELREGLESVDLRWEEQVTFHKKPNVELSVSNKPSVH